MSDNFTFKDANDVSRTIRATDVSSVFSVHNVMSTLEGSTPTPVGDTAPMPVQGGKVLTDNSSTSALNAAATYTGTWTDVSRWPSVVVAAKTDQNGTLYVDFSPDGTNGDSTLTLYAVAGTNEVHRFTVTRKYFRIRFTNTSASNQTYFRLQAMASFATPLTSSLNSTIQRDADATIVRPTDHYTDVAAGRVDGSAAFAKFGNIVGLTTSLTPVSTAGVYQTPTALTSLELVSSSASDTSAGAGARAVVVIGIGTDYAEVSETVVTNGTTAVALANQYYRVYRAYVSESGTYASASAASHVGTITLRVSGAGATWAQIPLTGSFGLGQTGIAAYTVPAGKVLYIDAISFSVNSTKAVDLIMFQRPEIDTVAAPYGAMRVVRQYSGLETTGTIQFKYPLEFDAYTDVGFLAKATSGTADLSVQMDGILLDA